MPSSAPSCRSSRADSRIVCPALRIRPFAQNDQAAARSLILDGLRGHWGWLDPQLNPDLDDMTADYTDQGHCLLVAEIDDVLVGAGALRIEGREGQIVRVSVAADQRGQGIGRAIVAALLKVARARGLARVWMETNDDWHDAIGLCTACGFRPFSRRDGCIFMERQVA